MNVNFKAIFTALFYVIVFMGIGYINILSHIEDLEKIQYKQFTVQLQTKIDILVHEKQDNNLLLGYSLSLNKEIKSALLNHNSQPMQLNDTLSRIQSFTTLNDVWVSLVDRNDTPVYQSWTNDDTDRIRGGYSTLNMANNPRISSEVVKWKQNIVSRVIVPVYSNEVIIGMITSFILFDDIFTTLEDRGYTTLALFENNAISNKNKKTVKLGVYEVFKNNSILYHQLQLINFEDLLSSKAYMVDKKLALLYTKYTVYDVHKNPLGYLLLSYPLSKIDLAYVTQVYNTMLILLCLISLFLLALIYYIYSIRYKKFMQKHNTLLELKVNEKTKTLRYLANHDHLTKLPNRANLEKILDDYIVQTGENPCSIYVLFLDLDRFKEVNDTYGHSIGDGLLIQVSQRIKELLSDEDMFGRVGGDEFVIYFKNVTQSILSHRISKIKYAMRKSFRVEELELFITCSIGVSHYPSNGMSAEKLLVEADIAMYEAKSKGKNTHQFYQVEMTEKVMQRQELSRDLRKALEEKEFEVYYQPKLNTSSGIILGLEALIRWNHPTKGFLTPYAFIELAEEIGLIVEIDTYVRNMALTQMVKWKEMGLKMGVLSLNISSKELESSLFFETLMKTIEIIGIDTKDIEFEVLENQIMQNQEQVIEVLKQMQSVGISIAIDDFGTGYSSLSYLQKLPLDKLKIDQVFISNLDQEKGSLEIIRMIIALAKTLGLEVIAEGVESQYHIDILEKEGCDNIQGYYFSKPLSAQNCEKLLVDILDKHTST